MRIAAAALGTLLSTCAAYAQSEDPGRRHYEIVCSRCHGGDGNGGEHGPGIVTRLFARDDEGLATLVRDGLPAAGMPGFPLPDQDMRELVAFLRTLKPKRGSAPVRATVETTDGRTLQGLALNQTSADLQLLSDDQRIHLLRKVGDRYRPVTSQADWPTYNGQIGGNRYSALDQIDKRNVTRFTGTLRWDTEMADWRQNYGATSAPLAVGGLVVSGTSGGDEGVRGFVAAFDQATGQEAWRFWTATTPISTRSTGRPAIPARITTAANVWATTCTRTRSWPSTPGAAG